MNKGRVFAIWLLILIPTLIIGIGSLVLLQHEQERIDQASQQALRDRAQLVVDDINLAVSSLQAGLIENLTEISPDALEDTLRQLEQENPMIRNAFICQTNGELKLPLPTDWLSDEKQQFIDRYRALFDGRVAWIERTEEIATVQSTAAPSAMPQSQQKQQREVNQVQGYADNAGLRNATVQEISKLARKKIDAAQQTDSPTASNRFGPRDEGWMPWYWENDFYLLGYIHAVEQGICYGVEVEMIALLARLTTALEPARTEQAIVALENKHGRLINYIGEADWDPDATPTITIPVGPRLPHYQVSIYSAGFSYGGTSGKPFLLVSSLLVGMFVLSILTGGFLLNAHARKSEEDALQKTSFVANVSHELKTPLTTIRMYTELLHDDRITDEPKRKRYLQVMLSESERLSRLVNNVLDFGRLEQGRKQYQALAFELQPLIEEVLNGQALRLEQEGFRTEVELPEQPIELVSDRDALEQVLLNVTDNAIKYAKQGKELLVQVASTQDRISVRVMDRGPGVPRAHQKRIFQKFHRVDDSLTAEQGGSGLGLSIARGLLEGLGGSLEVSDRPGGGAIFTIILPATPKGTPA